MSKIKGLLEVYPSTFAPTQDETLKSEGFRCPSCNGEGYHWQVAAEPYKKACKVCNGTGLLDAIIKIKWKAHEN